MSKKYYGKSWFLLCLMFLLVGSPSVLSAQTGGNKSADKQVRLKFDGLYRTDKLSHKKDAGYHYYSYLRFCENGSVVGISASLPMDIIVRLLKCEKNAAAKFQFGEYSIKDDHISFTTKSENGEVSYEGLIEKDSVKLNVFSKINNNSEKDRKYKFIRAKFDEK